MHQHKCLEVGYCYSGTGILMVEDRILSFSAGDISIVNHLEQHMSRAAQGSVSRWSYFWVDPPALLASIPDSLKVTGQDIFAGAGFANVISPQDEPDMCRAVGRIIEEIRNESSFGRRMMIRTLMAEVMTLLHRMYQDRGATTAAPSRTSVERVSAALQYLVNHYAEDVDVEELASLCHLSLTHFRRVFFAAVGIPPLEYLARLRIRMAAAMLQEEPDRSIMAVASDVGFESHNTFHRHFCKIIGMAPREWQRRAPAR
jgi:AraC-like DNA-binding protein